MINKHIKKKREIHDKEMSRFIDELKKHYNVTLLYKRKVIWISTDYLSINPKIYPDKILLYLIFRQYSTKRII